MNFKVGDKVKFKPEVLNEDWFHTALHLNHNDIYIIYAVCERGIKINSNFDNLIDAKWFELAGIKETKDKLLWTLLPFKQLEYVVQVMMFGAKKYSKDNWKNCNPEDYKEACMRHLTAYFNEEWLDQESNLPHLAHLICNALFLLWFKDNEKR
jgi:hypothetical protein